MNLDKAISEPFASLIEFHNQFNRNIKFSFGALSSLRIKRPTAERSLINLPTGGEPWGQSTAWRDAESMISSAEVFIAEIGITRASSAFEDYVIRSIAELHRFCGDPEPGEGEGNLGDLLGRLKADRKVLADELTMVSLFEVARNCVVHRSGRASPQLTELAGTTDLQQVIARWPKRNRNVPQRTGKWKVSIPTVSINERVAWQPRHAILASDAYYRLAKALDRYLVGILGERGIVKMAAHWGFFADPCVPAYAKLNPQVVIRQLLFRRYCVGVESQDALISVLRDVGKWDAVRKAFDAQHPKQPRAKRMRR